MKQSQISDTWLQGVAARKIHMEQLKSVELFNGRAAMIGILIGIIIEGLTGAGIAHQIGLGALIDGYTSCHTQYLPFCF
ncbi:high light inducible protein [Synechococcus sp. M16CYN]|uniref:high light inducible protein n=1 Tax=Synechococcus sp. M16CYN TaxID=3103139 RepID=UPI0030DF2AC5